MDRIAQVFKAENSREAAALRALDRAYKEGTHDRLHGMHTRHGRVSAWYGVEVANGYRVQIDATLALCNCRAGEAGMMCKHLAALADRAGCFDLLIDRFYERAFGPAPAVLDPIAAAHAEVLRLSRNPRSTSDWHMLQNARALLAAFMESEDLVAA